MLKNDVNVRYRVKISGGSRNRRWSPLVRFIRAARIGKLEANVFSRNYEDAKGNDVTHLYITDRDAVVEEYVECKFYGEWFKAPHICGTDCPLER